MPLLDSTIAQVVFAFVMIGLFALILRWTFSSETHTRRSLPDSATDPATDSTAGADSATDAVAGSGPDSTLAEGSPTLSALAPSLSPPTPSPAVPSPPTTIEATSGDDYGLLVPAAAVDSQDEAREARALLSQAGIRATTTVGADGRHRVLVFARDLHRARRLITRRPAP